MEPLPYTITIKLINIIISDLRQYILLARYQPHPSSLLADEIWRKYFSSRLFVIMHETTQRNIQEDSNFHIYHHESLRFLKELTFTKMSIILSFRGLFIRSCKVFMALLEVCKSDTIVAE
jgi:hypothetical protein